MFYFHAFSWFLSVVTDESMSPIQIFDACKFLMPIILAVSSHMRFIHDHKLQSASLKLDPLIEQEMKNCPESSSLCNVFNGELSLG